VSHTYDDVANPPTPTLSLTQTPNPILTPTLTNPKPSPNPTPNPNQVCGYSDWVEHGREKGMNAVKTAGKYRQEGKQYLVKDGDIIHFMFNVTADKKK
jgi:hypothetical protein